MSIIRLFTRLSSLLRLSLSISLCPPLRIPLSFHLVHLYVRLSVCQRACHAACRPIHLPTPLYLCMSIIRSLLPSVSPSISLLSLHPPYTLSITLCPHPSVFHHSLLRHLYSICQRGQRLDPSFLFWPHPLLLAISRSLEVIFTALPSVIHQTNPIWLIGHT